MSEFDQIIGYESIKEELKRYCDTMKNPETYRNLGLRVPRGVLLYGDPGIGKTLFAESFAKESGCKTYIIRKQFSDDEFVDYITETFEEAQKNAPAVIILDDIDKFSNSDFIHQNTSEFVAVQAGIDACRDSDVFVIATANMIDFLPSSLRRSKRFDRIIELTTPKTEEAHRIISKYLNNVPLEEDIDTEEIATLLSGRTCADLEKVVNEAGISAAYAGKTTIGKAELLDACVQLIAGHPKNMEPRKGMKAKLVAYHEAGHAIVSEFWKPGSVGLISIVGSNSSNAGITSEILEDERANTMEDIIAEVSTLLGGKAATKVLLDAEDTGCRNDIQNAYIIMDNVISDCAWGNFKGVMHGHEPSNFSLDARDRNISMQLDEIYQVTTEIISDNQALVKEVAEALMKNTTITYKDLRRIIKRIGWGSTDVKNKRKKCRKVS